MRTACTPEAFRGLALSFLQQPALPQTWAGRREGGPEDSSSDSSGTIPFGNGRVPAAPRSAGDTPTCSSGRAGCCHRPPRQEAVGTAGRPGPGPQAQRTPGPLTHREWVTKSYTGICTVFPSMISLRVLKMSSLSKASEGDRTVNVLPF